MTLIAVMVVFLHTAKDGFSEVEDILSLNVKISIKNVELEVIRLL